MPQGTLAEKLRAGGSGIAAFFTQTGVGTYRGTTQASDIVEQCSA
jgi:acyl CoA:acetate/3-ketoacid CoA transferase alpha subunit